jgi:hypothetical protein
MPEKPLFGSLTDDGIDEDATPIYQTCRWCGHPWGDLKYATCPTCKDRFDRQKAQARRINCVSNPPGIRQVKLEIDQ